MHALYTILQRQCVAQKSERIEEKLIFDIILIQTTFFGTHPVPKLVQQIDSIWILNIKFWFGELESR